LSFIRYERSDGIVMLTMSSPRTRNALSAPAIADLVAACQRADLDEAARVVVLTGEGSAFCGGGDVKEMLASLDDGLPPAEQIRASFQAGIQRLARTLHGLRLPVIAAVNGAAIGAGLDLACMCDLRIASRRAVFAESFVKLGLVPGDGGAWLLTRLLGPAKAGYLAFTGETIDAALALELGLVSAVVDDDQLQAQAQALAARIAAHSRTALRLTKQLLRASATQSFDEVLHLSAEAQAQAIHSPEHRVAVRSLADALSTGNTR
jgi:2-(1,2-epoxy-1,2-dihydrophenyl)acetyl-CoA isomerase